MIVYCLLLTAMVASISLLRMSVTVFLAMLAGAGLWTLPAFLLMMSAVLLRLVVLVVYIHEAVLYWCRQSWRVLLLL